MFEEDDFVLEIPGARGLARKNIAERANSLHEERCPYKSRPDNAEGNEYSQVMAMKDENARLREALTTCKIAFENNWELSTVFEQINAALEVK